METVNTNIDLSTIKLIIWDLDDTFWKGTISKNGNSVELLEINIKFVENLTNHGIMNSICSKNDFYTVKNFFMHSGLEKIWSQFVFPSINWASKGNRILDIINKMQLREQNVLFLDDNRFNLEEAKFYCPKIQTALPNVIPLLIEQSKNLDKQDINHSRLNQYKILEQKTFEKSKFTSNEKFLYSSNIQLEIKSDCLNISDRIVELINRTNQLNYTKNRMSKLKVLELLNNNEIENRYIIVSDNFGNYGICGFYSFDRRYNKIIHFLFSCRIIGMGVEQYVYSMLGFPNFEIVGDVAVNLLKNKYCNWINQKDKKTNVCSKLQVPLNNNYKILLKGPCDMHSVVSLLKSENSEFRINQNNFITEVDYYDDMGFRVYNSLRLVNIVNSHKLSAETRESILNDADFITKKVYDQTIFNKKYDVIVYSLLTDTKSIIYKHKKSGEIIAWDDYPDFTKKENKNFYQNNPSWQNFEYNKPNDIWLDEKIEKYKQNFECLGHMEPQDLLKYLDYLIDNVPKSTKWIFIIGNDNKPKHSLYSSPYWNSVWELRKKQNEVYRKFLKTKKNVTFIDMSKIITSKEDTTDEIDHFSRFVYYKLSRAIAKKINSMLTTNVVVIDTSPKIRLMLFIDKFSAPIKGLNKFIKKVILFFILIK